MHTKNLKILQESLDGCLHLMFLHACSAPWLHTIAPWLRQVAGCMPDQKHQVARVSWNSGTHHTIRSSNFLVCWSARVVENRKPDNLIVWGHSHFRKNVVPLAIAWCWASWKSLKWTWQCCFPSKLSRKVYISIYIYVRLYIGNSWGRSFGCICK